MTTTVSLPLWLLLLILAFAAATVLSHFLLPSVRWFFRHRMQRVVGRLNERLPRPIEPFKLARRHDTIQRLLYDPEVTAAIVEHSAQNGVPENVAFERARRYAREIVPRFSATAYFGFGTRAARWMSRTLYRVRLGAFDRAEIQAISPDATVIFVMNHRSNMDYVLVTYLAARTTTLSYAVGEWARVWPLSGVIRAMGAYFIRRRSRTDLYRRVLARYVQQATQGGVTQALFPEGGLSLDGRTAPPKLGLLSYLVGAAGPHARDVVFVPVALNYDRVLEDRILIGAAQSGTRRFRAPVGQVTFGLLRHLVQRLTWRFPGHGTASVSFGTPLSLREFSAGQPADGLTEALGAELMARIEKVIPIVPVPLVATALLQTGQADKTSLADVVQELLDRMAAKGVRRPVRLPEQLVADGLTVLTRRKLVSVDTSGQVSIAKGAEELLRFYANSLEGHLTADFTE